MTDKPQTNIPIKSCQVCRYSSENLMRCSRCKQVCYCGEQCQKQHWPTHKLNCVKKYIQKSPLQNKQKVHSVQGIDEFTDLKQIGVGNFSTVFKVKSKKDQQIYALKQIEKARVAQLRKQADLFMEKHCLERLKENPYVIRIYRTFQDSLNLYVQMQCPSNGQLWEKARSWGIITESIYKYYICHLVKAISILHSQYGILHRDLKPENILLDQKYEIKLIDFGTAKDLTNPNLKGAGNGLKGKKPFQHYVGTPNYMAPQCIHNKASELVSDVYSLSGVFYFLKTGSPPFTGGSQYIIFKKNLQTPLFTSNQLFSLTLQNLIKQMSAKEMTQRITIAEVMAHPYFDEIDFEHLPTYTEALSEKTPFEELTENFIAEQFNTLFDDVVDKKIEQRKQHYNKIILPELEKFKNKSVQFDQKLVQQRIKILNIQSKCLLNIQNDLSIGFAEYYLQKYDSIIFEK